MRAGQSMPSLTPKTCPSNPKIGLLNSLSVKYAYLSFEKAQFYIVALLNSCVAK
jgi:hypothetical protein